MFRHLLRNEWKETLRSPYLAKSIVQKALIGLFALYIAVNVAFLGIYMDRILEKTFPDSEPFVEFNKLLFYYFLFDLALRFFMQQFPVISIKPYLALPLKRNSLIHFLLTKSVPSFFNVLPLLVIVPFFVKSVLSNYPVFGSLVWLVAIICIILAIHFLSFYLKKNFDINPMLTIGLLAAVWGIYYLDSNGYAQLSAGLQQFLTALMAQPLLALVPAALLGGSYWLVFHFFRKKLYLDELSISSQEEVITGQYDFGLFDRFGKMGELMQLELKMIWRNKRSRTFLYMSLLFLFYPALLINGSEAMQSNGMKLMVSILVTGMFAFNYAQLLLSWHSTHFDFLLTRNIPGKTLFKTKYLMLVSTVLLSFVLTLPFCFLIDGFLYTNLAAMLFNMGISIFLYMYIANYNSKKIDPSKGGTFNFEGFGAAHYLVMLPIILLPLMIYGVFWWAGLPLWGIFAVGLPGLIGVLLREKILDWLTSHFSQRKYAIAADFRKQ